VARLREDTDRRIEEETARSIAENLLACQLRADAVRREALVKVPIC